MTKNRKIFVCFTKIFSEAKAQGRDISRAEGNEMKYAASKSPVDIEAFAELYKFTEP